MTDNNLEVNTDEDAARTIPSAPLAVKPSCSNAAAAANTVLEEPAPDTAAKSAPVVATCSSAAAARNHVPESAVSNTALIMSPLLCA